MRHEADEVHLESVRGPLADHLCPGHARLVPELARRQDRVQHRHHAAGDRGRGGQGHRTLACSSDILQSSSHRGYHELSIYIYLLSTILSTIYLFITMAQYAGSIRVIILNRN